jgi:hypothetical protein
MFPPAEHLVHEVGATARAGSARVGEGCCTACSTPLVRGTALDPRDLGVVRLADGWLCGGGATSGGRAVCSSWPMRALGGAIAHEGDRRPHREADRIRPPTPANHPAAHASNEAQPGSALTC